MLLTLLFAAGALISAVAFDLVEQSYRAGGVWRTGLGFAAGAAVFVLVDRLLDRWTSGSAVGFALLVAIVASNFPEGWAVPRRCGTTAAHPRRSSRSGAAPQSFSRSRC